MKWLPIAASLTFACLVSSGAGCAAYAQQTSSSPASPAAAPKTPKKTTKKHHTRRKPGQKAPTADRITEIQSALARGGYYQATPNGKWDSTTVAAVQKFQAANGIESNGKLDAPTLQKLGLGSDIAGVSAPKPIVPPTTGVAPASAPSSVPQSSIPPAAEPIASANSSSAPSSQANKSSEH